ncbi:hypothetical protein AVO52_16465 [Vibrio cholerae]|uniref:Uncharacterized protein n=2 Tax=Vibrio TaxID=662 RepID=A0A2T5EJE1_VIBSP|nr:MULTISPECIES: hypothetical protein [Vibrio]EGR4447762.1 hypothetical protein [Vibrio cholerae]EHY9845646.1 hypothetical protein [Vibrio cholerae]EKF9078767.1 hypothetical protein [Vibrio cholerae]ELY5192910.1 hypothetical protein [Vibrio cholerae]EMA7652528.1 hypothetical protein [Vibrio cholerae]
MTGKNITEFQRIANERGWTFKQIAERWGLSERQLSRIAQDAKIRDLDSVKGLPIKKKSK